MKYSVLLHLNKYHYEADEDRQPKLFTASFKMKMQLCFHKVLIADRRRQSISRVCVSCFIAAELLGSKIKCGPGYTFHGLEAHLVLQRRVSVAELKSCLQDITLAG